jgi:hypothetical protein
MKRTLFVLAVVVGFATAASGATLTMATDSPTYTPGQTITLTVTADDTGTTSYGIFGQVSYDATHAHVSAVQTQLVGKYGKWTTQPLPGGGGFSRAFSQITGTAQDANNLPGTLSTILLVAGVPGIYPVIWDTTNANPDLRLTFFGLTNAPGTSFTVIPEPTTAALLGLGLLGILVGGRRRS